MSKAEGKKIAIKFTEALVGAEATSTIAVGDYYSPDVVATASDQYLTYGPENSFDENTSTFWRTGVFPCWIQIELAEEIFIAGFRWTNQTSTWRPKDFTIQGSNDGESWETLYSGQSANITYWKEFSWTPTTAYKFYRWNIDNSWAANIAIHEIELLSVEVRSTNGNEGAFEIKGYVPIYVEYPAEELGPLTEKTFEVDTVIPHPSETDALLLTMKDLNEFKNVHGNLTVLYDASLGDLAGAGGAVKSFSKSFSPSDLLRIPDPLTAENISASITDFGANLIKIYHEHGHESENVAVSITDFSLTLINIDDLDP